MSIMDLMLKLALMGGEWVLYLLIALSVVALWIIIDRFIYFRSLDKSLSPQVFEEFAKLLEAGDIEKLLDWLKDRRDPVFSSLYVGLLNYRRGVDKVIQVAEGAFIPEKEKLEKGLTLLGTLGNNAPFIGLLGTVLGIIKAFADLAVSSNAGPRVVMAGISEALVATAVGLFVAIPSVIAFNAYRRKIRKIENFFEKSLKLIRGYLQ